MPNSNFYKVADFGYATTTIYALIYEATMNQKSISSPELREKLGASYKSIRMATKQLSALGVIEVSTKPSTVNGVGAPTRVYKAK